MTDSPNVLLVTTDHWPAALLGVAGHPVIQTPTLNSIAANGTHFTNCYSECPICIPARRTLMTGMSPKDHGDRTFQTELPMPNATTLAGAFRQNGYQATAVGKLHVFPQRDRIGFDDVILAEEGRPGYGVIDDYEIYLGQQGHVGMQFAHGLSNNEYVTRPWHLPEDCHVTNWTTREMVRTIRRRDPTRPAFWYLSYTHPHPPLAPLQAYLDMYRDVEMPDRVAGEWAESFSNLPHRLKTIRDGWSCSSPFEIKAALQAFYALCTHIDHQLRLVIGTLREEGLLDDTVIAFTSDHGDMLGHHQLWAKRLFYESSANVPLLIMGHKNDHRLECGHTDEQLVGLQDLMPTLLDLAGVPIPETVTGRAIFDNQPRDFLYGECLEGEAATRMIRHENFKLIYYSAGNVRQLFNLQTDPNECVDLSKDPEYQTRLEELTSVLKREMYGSDSEWVERGHLVGMTEPEYKARRDRGLNLQRGLHWPPAKPE